MNKIAEEKKKKKGCGLRGFPSITFFNETSAYSTQIRVKLS